MTKEEKIKFAIGNLLKEMLYSAKRHLFEEFETDSRVFVGTLKYMVLVDDINEYFK